MCVLCGCSRPHTDCVCSFALSWESWFDECKWHLFSGYADICHLAEEGCTEELKLKLDEVKLPLCSVNITALLMWGLIPPCGGEAFMVRPGVGSGSLEACVFPSPQDGILVPQRRRGAQARRTRVTSCLSRLQTEIWVALRHELLLQAPALVFLLCLGHSLAPSPFCPHSWSQPWDFAAPLCLETHLRADRALSGLWVYWDMRCDGDEWLSPETQASSEALHE